MHRGCQPRDERQRVHLDRDGAIPERTFQFHRDQAVGRQRDVLLGDGRSQHVLEQLFAAKIVLGAGSRGGVKRESGVIDAQGTDDLGTRPGGQSDLQRFSAQLGPRRRQSRNRGRGQLRQRRITLGEIVGKQHGVGIGVGLDDAAADEEPHHTGADDLEQIRDGRVRDAGQGVEHGLAVAAVGAGHEHSIQKHGMQVGI